MAIRPLKLYSLLPSNVSQLGFLTLLGLLQCHKLVSQDIVSDSLIDGLLFTPAIRIDARRQSSSDNHRAENQRGIVLTLSFCYDRLRRGVHGLPGLFNRDEGLFLLRHYGFLLRELL